MALVRVRPARPPVKAARKPRHSPSPRPRQLPTAARSAQPSEPIFFPKLQIHFADFPYLHASSGREAVHLGDLLRIWVRAGAIPPSPPRDFQGPRGRPCMPRELRHSSPKAKTHSPCETIRGPRRLMQKRQLFAGLRRASPGRVALPRQTRGSERFRGRVPEYGPDSLSASPWPENNQVTRHHAFDQGFP